MQSRIYKGMDGWRATTEIPFGTGNQILEIRTSKRSAGLVAAYASVSRVQGGFKTFMVFSDFSKIVEQAQAKRITADVIKSVHEAALKRIDEIKAEAEAHYAAKQEAA